MKTKKIQYLFGAIFILSNIALFYSLYKYATRTSLTEMHYYFLATYIPLLLIFATGTYLILGRKYDVDKFLATEGLLLATYSLLVIYMRYDNYHARHITTGIGAASLIYLIFRKRFREIDAARKNSGKGMIALNILFYAMFVSSILSLKFGLYKRPLTYFILATLMGFLIVLEIFYNDKKLTHLTLIKIFLLALNLRWSQLLIVPGIIGIDPLGHRELTNLFTANKHIMQGYFYAYYPAMHLLTSSMMLLTGLGYKLASIATTGFLEAASLLFVYLIGKKIAGNKAGLLSALIVGLSDMHTLWGIQLIPTSIGLFVITILFYTLLREEKRLDFHVLLIIFSGFIIFVHTLSSFAWLFILISIYIGILIFRLKDKGIWHLELTFILLFFILLTTYWMYVSGFLGIIIRYSVEGINEALSASASIPDPIKISALKVGQLKEFFGDTSLYFLLLKIRYFSQPFGNAIKSESLIKILTFLKDIINNFVVFLALGTLGIFVWAKKKEIDYKKALTIIASAFILVIIFSSGFTSSIAIPERWYVMFYIFIGPAIATFIIYLSDLLCANIIKKTIFYCFILLLFFSSIIFLSEANQNFRLHYIDSEFEASDYFENADKPVITDVYYGYLLKQKNTTREKLGHYIYSNKTFENNSIILIRDYLFHNDVILNIPQIASQKGYEGSDFKVTLDENQKKTLQNITYDRIYDNSKVTGYLT